MTIYYIYSITIYLSYDYILNDVSLFVRRPMLQQKTLILDVFAPSCGSSGTNEPLGTTCQGVTGAVATGAMRKFGWPIFYQPFIPGWEHPKIAGELICKGCFFPPNMPETFRFRNDKQFWSVDVDSGDSERWVKQIGFKNA